MNKHKFQMSESLAVGLLLAAVGGFLESYSYLTRDGVFANCQTGNMVLLTMNLFKGNLTRTFSYLIPILSFIVGIVLTEMVRFFQSRQKNGRGLHWRQHIILFEIVLLALAGLIPSGKFNIIATTLIAFSCSMQVESFRKVKGSVFATTMCTGNLRSGTYQLFQAFAQRDTDALRRAGHYFAVILIFMAGVGAGYLLTVRLLQYAIFIACGILLVVFFIMFIQKDTEPELNG